MRIFPFFLHTLFNFFHQPKCAGSSGSLGGRNKSLRESAVLLSDAQDCEECAGKVELLWAPCLRSNIRKTEFKAGKGMSGVKGQTSGCSRRSSPHCWCGARTGCAAWVDVCQIFWPFSEFSFFLATRLERGVSALRAVGLWVREHMCVFAHVQCNEPCPSLPPSPSAK